MQSTQHYIDNERDFIANISQKQPSEVIEFKTSILPMVEQVDIDTDIEKEIAQLQEARMNEGIKKVVPVDFDTELGSFFSSIKVEKEELQEKVKKEAVKIAGLEDLFNELSSIKKKKVVKRKEVLVVEPAIEVEVESVNEVVVAEKEVEESEDIISQVSKQLSEMQLATELDKDKLKGLESIDSLDKLKKEFINFKDIVARQMGTIGGGGEVRLEFLDDVQKSTAVVDGKFLKYSSSAGKFIGADASDDSTTGVTAGTISASKAVIVDSNKDITGFRNVTITGDLTVEGSTTTIDSTTINVQTQFVFEGATDDAYETTFNVVDPTADRTITLPNISGTLPVLAVASTTQITATPEELNYSDGVTSNIQTQIDANTTLANTKATKAFAIAQAVALG
ncbi:MAG: hypothetical protein H8D92_00095 [Pelagibacteraceae bacterium]|nr:hypothetical protein [Pelagibacteraceae bacterium]